MNLKHLPIVSALALGISSNSKAMLVAYQDSLGIMGFNQAFHTELFLNYSLTSHFAVGERNIRFATNDGVK
jgi:hypothetical protein